jgi:RHS repeat-associated protein
VTAVRDLTTGRVFASELVHAAGGPVTSLRFGNGLGLAQSFGLQLEPLAISSGPLSLAYQSDAAGNLVSVQEGGAAQSMAYDLQDRLLGGGALGYGYDANGNRTSTTADGSTLKYAYTSDKVTGATMQVGTSTVNKLIFANDNQGAMSEVGKYTGSNITAVTCLRHDPLGRVSLVGTRSGFLAAGCLLDSQVTTPTARFRYDGLGRRVARQDPASGVWTYFLHGPGGQVLAEATQVSGGWAPAREYVWLEGKPLAQVEYGSGAGRAYYHHVDHLGLPRRLTNETGQVVWSAAARPYGELTETTTPDPLTGRTVVTNLRLPGQYDERLLGNMGLQGPYYNWNRWYLPTMGRYMELDPIALAGGFNGPFGPNWYGYAEGNPLENIDYDGRDIYSWSHENLPWLEGNGWGARQSCMARCMDETNPLSEEGAGAALALGPLPKWPVWRQPGASHFTSLWRYLNIGSRSVCGSPLFSGPTTKMLGRGGVYATLAAGFVSYGVISVCAIHCAGGQ